MAKKREISKRSRAARRATSPSIDVDKSLKDIAPPRQGTYEKNSVLSVHNNAGVSKRLSKRKTQMSAKARKRQQRGMDMAEAVLERRSKKVQVSKGRARVVQDRAKNWEDINKILGVDDDDEEEVTAEQAESKEWETDEDMDAGKEIADAVEAADAEETPAAAAVEAAPVLDKDLDEIL